MNLTGEGVSISYTCFLNFRAQQIRTQADPQTLMSLWKKTGKQSAKKENNKQLYSLKGRRCVLFNFNNS